MKREVAKTMNRQNDQMLSHNESNDSLCTAIFLVNSKAHMRMFRPIIAKLKKWKIYIVNIGFFNSEPKLSHNMHKVPFLSENYKHPSKLLSKLNPNILICAIDTTFIAKLFIQGAKALSIPTLHIQDGIIDPDRKAHRHKHLKMLIIYSIRELFQPKYNFILKIHLLLFLVNAIIFRNYEHLGGAFQGHSGCDKIVCFGPMSASILISEGIPEDRIAILGNPKFDLIMKSMNSVSLIKAQIGISERQRVILVTTQYFVEIGQWSITDRFKFIENIIDSLKNIENTICIIKPHSIIEKKEIYEDIVEQLHARDFCRILSPDLNTEKLIAICDLLITTTSTTAFEAIAINKPIIIYNISNYKKAKTFDKHGIWYAEKKKDLHKIIPQILSNPQLKYRDSKAVEKFFNNNISLHNGMASKKIARLVAQMASA